MLPSHVNSGKLGEMQHTRMDSTGGVARPARSLYPAVGPITRGLSLKPMIGSQQLSQLCVCRRWDVRKCLQTLLLWKLTSVMPTLRACHVWQLCISKVRFTHFNPYVQDPSNQLTPILGSPS